VLADRAVTLHLSVPDRGPRERLRQAALGASRPGLSSLRMTSGNIVRAGTVARAGRAVTGATTSELTAVCATVRTLQRLGLEALARRVDTAGNWSPLAMPLEGLTELTTLAACCRQRERLGSFVGAALELGPGIRALFKGPSGTGKTLAARLLAGALTMDLNRVDLAAVVNKYIGETEKNLERVFARAEELDVIFLLDLATHFSPSEPACRTPPTGTRTSGPTTCCSGSSRTRASCSSPPTPETASTALSVRRGRADSS
jgi:hypothetical protein